MNPLHSGFYGSLSLERPRELWYLKRPLRERKIDTVNGPVLRCTPVFQRTRVSPTYLIKTTIPRDLLTLKV